MLSVHQNWYRKVETGLFIDALRDTNRRRGTSSKRLIFCRTHFKHIAVPLCWFLQFTHHLRGIQSHDGSRFFVRTTHTAWYTRPASVRYYDDVKLIRQPDDCLYRCMALYRTQKILFFIMITFNIMIDYLQNKKCSRWNTVGAHWGYFQPCRRRLLTYD